MWKLPASTRLSKWQDFRHSIDDLPLETALEKVSDLWSSTPCMPYYLDHTNIGNWPDPWELITENYYCDIARCLGIVYTIYFSRHRDEIEPEVRVYQDADSRHLYTVVWLNDGKYILNYSDGEIVNTRQIEEKQLKLLHQYSSIDLKLDQY